MASNSKLHSKSQLPNKPRGRGGGRGRVGEEVHRIEREFHGSERGGRGRGGTGDLTRDAHGQPEVSPLRRGGRWSGESVSFREAIDRAPVLVRLEEGYRGPQEVLSLSAGDVLALAGVTERDAGTWVVMGYHVEDLHPEGDGGGKTAACDESPYRALLALPLNSIPSLAVYLWEEEEEEEEEDPASGQSAFSRFVATRFADYDWAKHRDELLDKMGDNYYINVSSITPVPPRLSPRSSDKEDWDPQIRSASPPPPALPPRVARTLSSPPPATVGVDAGAEGGANSAAHRPPRPPRAEKGSSNRTPSPATPGDLPPPRPPRLSGREPPRKDPPPRPSRNDQGEADEEGDTEVFDMPALAELFSSDALRTDVRPTPEPAVLLPEKVPKDKKKKKKPGLMTAARMMGKMISEGVSKLSLSSQSSLDEGAAAATAGAEISADDDDDDDDSDNYDEINESKMDPVFDTTPKSSRAGEASDTTLDRKGKGDKSKAARKAPKASAVVTPTVRASPQGTGHPTLTSQPTSPTSKQPTSPASKLHTEDINEDDDPPTSVSAPLQGMTCSQLCFRLRQCGMRDLAQVCHDNSVDGAFFCALSNAALKKAPFKLGSFEVETKLMMVKAGWVPK